MMELYPYCPLRLHGVVIDGFRIGAALRFISFKLYGRDMEGYKSFVGEHEYIALAAYAQMGRHY
jgi:hypothetical protein